MGEEQQMPAMEPTAAGALKGLVRATRKGVCRDWIASAWLNRRFGCLGSERA
jgi:hypothetical protein